MSIKVLFFGQLKEVVQTDQVQLTGVKTAEEVRLELLGRFPDLAACSFQMATNHELNSIKTLKDGDELALLPPFAGG